MTRRLLLQTLFLLLLRPMCYAAQPLFTGLWGTEFEIKSPKAAELHEQAWKEFFKGDFPKAIAAVDAALKTLGSGADSIIDQSTILATKAEALLNLGRSHDAREVLQTARNILATAPAAADAARIRLLRDESILAFAEGNLLIARQKLAEAVVKIEVNGLTNRPVYAVVLNIEAGVAVAGGDFSEALQLIETSSMILEKQASPNWFLEGLNSNILTQVWIGLGDFATAARHSDRSLERLRRVISEKHVLYVIGLNQKALIFERLGKSELAIPSVQMGLNALVETMGRTNAMVAFSYQTLGNQFLRTGQSSKAISAFDQAFEISRDLLGPESPSVAYALNGIGMVNLDEKHYPDAVRYFTASAGILIRARGTNDLNVATVLHNLGLAHLHSGEIQRADAIFTVSTQIQRARLPRAHPVICSGLEDLAVVAAVRGDFDQATKQLAAGADLRRVWLSGQVLGISNSDALSAVEDANRTVGLHEALVAHIHGRSQIEALKRGAVCVAESKALLEEALAVRNRMEMETATDFNARRERLTWLNQQMASVEDLLSSPGRPPPTPALQAERELIENDLIQRDNNVARLLQKASVSIELISAALPNRGLLLDFVRYDAVAVRTNGIEWLQPHYAVYSIAGQPGLAGNSAVGRLELGLARPIDDACEELHRLIAEGLTADRRLRPLLDRLGSLILAPITNELPQVEHLVVCPAGLLSRVPFEALRNPATGRYLIEDKRISYVSSGREVVRIAQARISMPTNAPVVMGSPDFDLSLAASAGKVGHTPVRIDYPASFVAALRPATLSRDARGRHFAPLPETEREARSSSKLLGKDCVLRLGAEAREAELKRVVSPRILHLATHGFYFTDQEFNEPNSLAWSSAFARPGPPKGGTTSDWENPLIRCGIALAGANHASSLINAPAEDGILTGLEASLLNLQGTELVILSACQTGAGDVRIGEGVMSLRRAFTIAGAQSVLASHWRVSDEATSRLITEFLGRWRGGKSRVEALREAQLSLLRSKEYSSPYLWASFTLTGRWD